VSFLPALSSGASVVLLEKFDVEKFLKLSEKYRVTNAMLVPVQYRRIMEHPDFDKYDLSAYQMKYSTSAPFPAAIKADVLKRWPGGLIEFFGMTEGGGGCMLVCHQFPDKLHTVGKPQPGVDLRLIDENGKEVPQGEIGEIVGHSAGMMKGYHNQPGKTADAWWYDETGKKFMRFGDVGRFDEDGFLQLMDRKKDMIISGGFNVYPSDIEAIMMQNEAILEVAVVGVESDRWGETPVAYVTLRPGATATPAEIKEWTNSHPKLGKTQRLHDVVMSPALPRSAIGKVLKRELRDEYKEKFGVAG
jgi:acyl-CoA synthetase (AMP-forming)/AMP-acid ligase II